MTARISAISLLALGVAAVGVPVAAQRIEPFPLDAVRLLDGPFRHALETNRRYVMAMDPDRLLAPYLEEAGLPPKAEPYGNWESSGLGGHIGGHYLSALSLLHAATGDPAVLERLESMLAELRRAQEAHGDGYLGGVPGGREAWAEITAGRIDAEPFSLNDAWVPWYNLHKVYAGLRDAWLVAGLPGARDMLVDLADWAMRLTDGLTDGQMQTMLRAEHGGMNEVFADVAAITGDPRYLELAVRFSDRTLLDPLLRGEDPLTGLHANTQIPKVIGFDRVAEVAAELGVDGYQAWHGAAALFWDQVVGGRSVVIGGNSVGEHFHPKDDFEPMITRREGPETCNTYNMLRLTRRLLGVTGDRRYGDYAERALFNHILSSQHPEHGGLVYFSSMRPGHYRVYSQVDQAMWCCVGSGIESQSKYGAFVYAHRENELYVNLFVASTLDWEERGVRITQETRFPDEETSTIRVDEGGPFVLRIRHPEWVAPGALSIAVNGEAVPSEPAPGGYVRIDRGWQAGDRIEILAPMRTTLEQMPDGSEYYAVLHGPIVLAAKVEPFGDEQLTFVADDSRFGHVANGPMCPPEAAPVFVGDPTDFVRHVTRVEGEPLVFRAPGRVSGQSDELTLIPFFRLHDARYEIYWPHVR